MADKSLGLGKLLAKSKSTIRRARRGSVDGSNSVESDDATTSSLSFARGPSSVSHMSQPLLDSHALHGHRGVPGPGGGGGGDDSSIIIHPPAVGDDGDGDGGESATSLVSSVYDSEDPELW